MAYESKLRKFYTNAKTDNKDGYVSNLRQEILSPQRNNTVNVTKKTDNRDANKTNLAMLNKVEPDYIPPSVEKPLYKLGSIDALKAVKDYFTQPKEDLRKQQQEFAKTPLAAVGYGITDSATLGLNKRITGQTGQELYNTAKQSNPLQYIAGQAAGYLLPGTGAAKATAPLTNLATRKIGSEVGKRVIEGAISGTAIETAESLIRGNGIKETAKNIGTGAVIGAAADAALYGLGKIGSSILKKIAGNINLSNNELNVIKTLPEEIQKQIQNKVVPVSPKGNFKIKNTKLENAQTNYNNAIKQIQNYFGTDQLRTNEINRIKPELGIDLDKLISDITKAENTQSIGTNPKLKRAAGVASDKQYNILDNLVSEKTIRNNISNISNKPYKTVSEINNAIEYIDNQKLTPKLQQFAKNAREKLVKQRKAFEPENGGDADSFMNKINYNPKKKKNTDTFLKLKTQLVDKFAPLEQLEKNITGKINSAEKSLYKQSRLFEGTPEKANRIITEELQPIIKSVEDSGFTYKDLGAYAEAIHARDVNNAGINSGFTNDEINDVINKYGTPAMEEARQKLIDYSDKRLKSLLDGQIITKESYNNIRKKWPNYMPLNRAFDDNKVEFGQALSRSFSGVKSPVKSLKGSNRKVIDPIESLIKNTFETENAISRNRVGLEISRLARKDSQEQFIRELDPGEATGRKNIVTIKEFGEDVKYEVTPEVYKAIKNLNKEASNMIINALSKPASVLRSGATLTPEFALRNPMRDVLNAFIVSKSGFNPITDFAAGLASYAKKDDLYRQFISNKGAYGNIMSMDRDLHRQILNNISKDTASKKFINIINPASFIKLMRTISDATESATKIGEYKAALRSGATPEEAAYRARDLMDFSRSGNVTKEWNKITAFLNANIQGKSKLIRAIKENPVKVGSKMITSMALPSLAAFAATKYFGNENQKATIKDAPNWLRDTFWLVPVPGTDVVARIPKPFDTSIVSNLLERFLEYFQNNDKNAFDGFLKNTIKSQSIPVMFTAIQPILEGATNYSFFREAPIIPQREKYLQSKDQYDVYTSNLAKLVAKGTGTILGQENNFSSPRVIDNILKGTTAGVGTYALDAIDYFTGSNKPAKNTSQLPGLKGFTVNNQSSGKSLEFLYDTKEKLTREKNSNKETFNKNSELNYLNNITKKISEISAEIRFVQNDNMSPQEKRDKINMLTDLRNKISRESKQEYQNKFN